MENDKQQQSQAQPEETSTGPLETEIKKENFKEGSKWIRLLFMVLFVIFHYVVRVLVYLVAIVQFITVLCVNRPNENLLKFGQSLSYYSYQIFRFLTYNTNEKPFPFGAWPSDKV